MRGTGIAQQQMSESREFPSSHHHRWNVLLSFLTYRRRWLDCSVWPHLFFFFLRSLLEEAESQKGEVIGENISALRNTNSWHFVNADHVPRPVLGTRTYLHQVITWFSRGSWTSVYVCVRVCVVGSEEGETQKTEELEFVLICALRETCTVSCGPQMRLSLGAARQAVWAEPSAHGMILNGVR